MPEGRVRSEGTRGSECIGRRRDASRVAYAKCSPGRLPSLDECMVITSLAPREGLSQRSNRRTFGVRVRKTTTSTNCLMSALPHRFAHPLQRWVSSAKRAAYRGEVTSQSCARPPSSTANETLRVSSVTSHGWPLRLSRPKRHKPLAEVPSRYRRKRVPAPRIRRKQTQISTVTLAVAAIIHREGKEKAGPHGTLACPCWHFGLCLIGQQLRRP